MTHRVLEIPGDGPTLVILHAAKTPPEKMAALVGPMPGFRLLYPESASNEPRWDHLGSADSSFIAGLGGDFIAGYSSGAFMAFRMLQERQYKGAMILAGGLLGAYQRSWKYQCPLMLCHGTADAQVPYDGKMGQYEAGMDAAIILRRLMGIAAPRAHVDLSDSTYDGTRAYVDYWTPRLQLYTVLNGGHTWPGPVPQLGLGRVCRDFSLTTEMARWYRRLA